MRITVDNVCEQLQAHNPEALSFLIHSFGSSVLTLARKIIGSLGSAEDVEECVSDVFLTAWTLAEDFDSRRAGVRTWLLMLTKYQALAVRRRLLRRPACVGDPAEVEGVAAEGLVAEPVLQEILAQEEQRLLTRCITTMDLRLREVFVRRYLLGASIPDIARELRLSRGAVDNRLYRARRWLRGCLDAADIEKGAH